MPICEEKDCLKEAKQNLKEFVIIHIVEKNNG